MIRYAYNYFTKHPPIPAIFLSGCLYIGLAITQFLQMALASDEAGKFIELETLWWVKLVVGSFATGLLALKLFTSTIYAEHVERTKPQEKPVEPVKVEVSNTKENPVNTEETNKPGKH